MALKYRVLKVLSPALIAPYYTHRVVLGAVLIFVRVPNTTASSDENSHGKQAEVRIGCTLLRQKRVYFL